LSRWRCSRRCTPSCWRLGTSGSTGLGAVGVVEVGLLAQLVIGIVQYAGTDRDVSGPFFIGYLIGSLIILPIGAFWALADSSRWGAGALAIACLVIPILELRLHDLWAV
jgi:hypothetical protein